ncbi:MAG TPA: M20/M25/M40 family metallo-hydrolase [Gemmatimonadaceae bacterium]|nr:M20/M25/M40 family metallo-hydrolase [Gemmatimonadaceae bacterium]
MSSATEVDVRRIHLALADARARLARADDHVMRDQLTVSEIPAPTGDESERGRWVAQRFVRLAMHEVRADAAGNVIGARRGMADSAPVVVCAHLDTVFPRETALRFTRDGTRYSGPGIGDNGRGLAALLALAGEIDGHRVQTRRPILFVATTGEEGAGDLRGAKHLFGHDARGAAAAIALDGAGDDRIVHRALGARRLRVRFHGMGGHSWAAYGIANPVHAAALASAALARITLPASPRTTLSVNRIGGGLSINSIADEAWLEVDIRSTSAAMLDRLASEVRAASVAAEHEENARRSRGSTPLAHTVEIIGDRPCGETPRQESLVQAAIAATRLAERDAELTLASTDANVPISLGVPAIAIGAGGRGGDAHTTGEWFDNADGHVGLGRALDIVVAAAGLP